MVVRRLARLLLSAIFVSGGVDAFLDPGPRAAMAEKLGLPNAEALVRANAGVMVAAGLALATSRLPRLSSAVLAGSLVPTTLAGHRFWEESEPRERKQQQIHFLKNLGLLGGLLMAALDTQGRESRVRRAKRALRVVDS